MKLGIIGSGKIVNDFLTISDQITGLQVTALATTSRSHQTGLDLQKQYNIENLYTDNQALINDQNVDTIYVGVPNNLHFAISKLALVANKNVICEKPLVYTVAEAQELKALADKHKVIILEAITNIYLENFKKIKANLDKIAPIHILNFNYTQYSSRYDAFLEDNILPAFDKSKGGGALMDLNIYNIHVATALLGKPTSSTYFPNIQKNIDTSGILILNYSDVRCSLVAAKDSDLEPNISTIEGEKGSITITGRINSMDEISITMRNQTKEIFKLNRHPHRMFAEFAEFVKIIDNHDLDTANKAFEHSLIALDVLEQAHKTI